MATAPRAPVSRTYHISAGSGTTPRSTGGVAHAQQPGDRPPAGSSPTRPARRSPPAPDQARDRRPTCSSSRRRRRRRSRAAGSATRPTTPAHARGGDLQARRRHARSVSAAGPGGRGWRACRAPGSSASARSAVRRLGDDPQQRLGVRGAHVQPAVGRGRPARRRGSPDFRRHGGRGSSPPPGTRRSAGRAARACACAAGAGDRPAACSDAPRHRHLLQHQAERQQGIEGHADRQRRHPAVALPGQHRVLGQPQIDDRGSRPPGCAAPSARRPPATPSTMLEVDRLVTTGPGRRRRRAAAASGSADLLGQRLTRGGHKPDPVAVDVDARRPGRRRSRRVSAASSCRLAALGAGGWAKRPVGSSFSADRLQPSASR